VNIGISQRVDNIEAHNEWRDALDQRMNAWVIEAGFIPVPVPNSLVDMSLSGDSQPMLERWLHSLHIDALLLSGGNDIGSVPHRDLTERYLLRWAEKNSKPVLGICRGMQMIGTYSGVELIHADGHVNTRHQLNINYDYGQSLPKSVNSYHNLVLQECPTQFEVLATSEDGNIEAIMHRELSWEGWMWHPEREEKFSINDLDRFKKLIINGK
jgi:putative glutamine amidotransferase